MSLTPSTPRLVDNFGSVQPMALTTTSENVTSLDKADQYDDDEDAVRFYVTAPPGVVPQETHVSVDNGLLRVKGDRHAVSDDGRASTDQHFEKTFTINQDALNVENMKTRLDSKTLVIEIPKKRRIEYS